MPSVRSRWIGGAAAVLLVAAIAAWTELPVLGAGGLLHPARSRAERSAPDGCVDAAFAGAGVRLRGWRCSTPVARRGTIVYLHGIADNRGSAAGAIARI